MYGHVCKSHPPHHHHHHPSTQTQKRFHATLNFVERTINQSNMTNLARFFIISFISLFLDWTNAFSTTSPKYGSQRRCLSMSSRVKLSAEPPQESSSEKEILEEEEEEEENISQTCPKCGAAVDDMLCDGTGRKIGGLGAVLPWLPVKAYRPCPNLVESGGMYQRTGQGLDEIAFGRDSTFKPGE